MAKPPRVPKAAQDQSDMVELLGYPAFGRFLFRIALASDMFGSASGTEDRHLRHAEGRRSLGLDIFRMADDALSAAHPSGLPITVLSMVMREASPTPIEGSADDSQDPPDEYQRA